MNRMKREADRNIKLQGEASKILNKNKNAVTKELCEAILKVFKERNM